MENFHILMAGLTAVILFVFGLENFSREIERISGERFRKSLANATRLPIFGVIIGALVTAVIQSSSATSVITIGLVNAGVLSFKNSVGIIFGTNVGTTITAQLVAFKLTMFAPIFVILGFALSIMRNRFSIFGKAVFYFGFVFFSLNLIASSLEPLQNNPTLIAILTQPQHPLYAILFGCLFTAIVQSSSVTTGLAIIFTQQGLLSLENAVPLVMGANIGTTATALVAMFNMDVAAKKAALTHFLFNFGGVLLFLPALLMFGDKLSEVESSPATALANIHLVINVAASLVFLLLIKPFIRLVNTILGEGEMEFERLPLPVHEKEDSFTVVSNNMDQNIHGLFYFLQENYNLVTLSIETNYRGVYETSQKRIEYIEFVKMDYMNYFSSVAVTIKEEEESQKMIRMVNQFDYLFQIHDSIVDLMDIKKLMSENYIELKSDTIVLVRELASETLSLFDDIQQHLAGGDKLDIPSKSQAVQEHLNEVNRELLKLLANPDRRDTGMLTNFSTYSQRLKDKLLNFYKIRYPQSHRYMQLQEKADDSTN